MALKHFKPITPSLRQLVIVDRSELYKGKPVKKLTEGKSSSGGRNNLGRITVRFRGGGHKRTLRLVDFKRRGKAGIPATVERIEYDPNRTAFIALIKYQDGEQSYILAPQRLAVGDTVLAGDNVDVKPGNAAPMGSLPIGTIVHNVELKIGKGGALARSAGNYAQLHWSGPWADADADGILDWPNGDNWTFARAAGQPITFALSWPAPASAESSS